jgi:hypothetical protein
MYDLDSEEQDEAIRSYRDQADDYRAGMERQDRLIASMRADLDAKDAEIVRLRELHAEVVGELYGQGFYVVGWHLNGDHEPLDSWFEENGWCDADKWQPTSQDTRKVTP